MQTLNQTSDPQETTKLKIRSTDIHNHILPGTDDGFRHTADSLEALSLLAAAGVREITFTPHLNPEQFPDSSEELLRARYEEFSALIPKNFGMKTGLAAEYMIVGGFEERVRREPEGLLCWSDKSILVEMSYYFRSPNLEAAVLELVMDGFRPILAHPERYLYMAGCLEDFDTLRENGCRFQCNYMSLTGAYGGDSIRILKYLAKKGWIDFLSSDLHSLHQLHSILDGKMAFPLRWPKRVIEI